MHNFRDIKLKFAQNVQFNGTYWMKFVSLKILVFGQVMGQKWRTCPYLSIRFLAKNQPFLGQLGWNFLWELRRLLTIDCSEWEIKVMRLIFHFWLFGPPTKTQPTKIQPKSWPSGWTFWANCYLENVLSKRST